jgi:hypothetical protein
MSSYFTFERVAIEKGKEKETIKKLLDAVEKFSLPELSNNPKQQVINSLKKEKSREFEEFCFFLGRGAKQVL